MHQTELPPANAPLRPPVTAGLYDAQPSISELFAFMAEAELRFASLRLRIADRRFNASGEEVETSEVWLRHPGFAKVIQTRGEGAGRDYDAWVSDGEHVQTYTGRNHLATRRRVPPRPVGAAADDLPEHARLYVAVTPLPAETLAETFVHPHGFCQNVLATGAVRLLGTAPLVGGREALLLRCDHPRTSHVLTDRPDHWLEMGVDRQTGMIVLLAEHVGGRITRHGEVTALALDETLGDEIFTVHVSADTTRLY